MISIFLSDNLEIAANSYSEEKESNTIPECKTSETDSKRNIRSNDEPNSKDKTDIQAKNLETEA